MFKKILLWIPFSSRWRIIILSKFFDFDDRLDKAQKTYKWFRIKDNRFNANGLHGLTGNYLYEAHDKDLKTLDDKTFANYLWTDLKRSN